MGQAKRRAKEIAELKANRQGNNSISKEVREIIKITMNDFIQGMKVINDPVSNENSLRIVADCKEILRYGSMVPSNCINLINYIQTAPFINEKIEFNENRIGFIVYEHKKIMEEFDKTMDYVFNGFMGIVEYKDITLVA